MRGPGMMSSRDRHLELDVDVVGAGGADVAGEPALEQDPAGADPDRHHDAGRELLAGLLAGEDVELVEVRVQVARDEPGHEGHPAHVDDVARRSAGAGRDRRSTRCGSRRA